MAERNDLGLPGVFEVGDGEASTGVTTWRLTTLHHRILTARSKCDPLSTHALLCRIQVRYEIRAILKKISP